MAEAKVPRVSGNDNFQIVGEDVRPGGEFVLTQRTSWRGAATFVAAYQGKIHVTRCLDDLLDKLPDPTPIVAHWHGEHRTDAFAITVRELKALRAVQRAQLDAQAREKKAQKAAKRGAA